MFAGLSSGRNGRPTSAESQHGGDHAILLGQSTLPRGFARISINKRTRSSMLPIVQRSIFTTSYMAGVLMPFLLVVVSGQLVVPTRVMAQGADQADLLHEFDRKFKSESAAERITAIRELASTSEAVADIAVEKDVALALVRGLRDVDDSVALEALAALARGRDPAITGSAVSEYILCTGRRMRKIITDNDGESEIQLLEAPSRNYVIACGLAGSYLRPGGSDALATELRAFVDLAPARRAFGHCEEAIIDALLCYGTKSALDAVIEHMKSYYLYTHEIWLVRLDSKLRAFCAKSGLKPAKSGGDMAYAWQVWYHVHRGELAASPVPGRLPWSP